MNTPAFNLLALEMCEQIKQEADMTLKSYPAAIIDYDILRVINSIPRHMFIPATNVEDAYFNDPTPIGYGQTISQPYIVALMTSLLNLRSADTVLEIGTGSGYQAAILSRIAKRVYTTEIIPELCKQAKKTLDKLHINNVHCECKDGKQGLPDFSPYDGIMLTASAKELPIEIIRQLKTNAKLVTPLDEPTGEQNLYVFTKLDDGACSKEFILPVRFVPLV